MFKTGVGGSARPPLRQPIHEIIMKDTILAVALTLLAVSGALNYAFASGRPGSSKSNLSNSMKPRQPHDICGSGRTMTGGTLYMICLCAGAFGMMWRFEVKRKLRD